MYSKKLTLILIFLFAYKGYSEPISYAPNSCLVNSITIYEDISKEFRGKNIWNNILIFALELESEDGKPIIAGHAVSIFNWKGKYFVYDVNKGSFSLKTKLDLTQNPKLVAEILYPNTKIKYATYMLK